MHGPSGFHGEPKLTWKGHPGFKPILLLVGFVLFAVGIVAPPPRGLLDLVTRPRPPGYRLEGDATNI
ncbi:MAG: hypothetical protein HY906_18320, partial [Deltaproteobacteria bacterium]|nr:hypothetical protein [Deltaproteobacteria bacterium]